MPFIATFLIVISLVFGSFSPSAETPTTQKWFWAWIPDKQQLVAYSPDGKVNRLMDGVYPFKLRRIDDQTAVVMGKVGNEYSAYIVSATDAYPVTTVYDETYAASLGKDSQISGWFGPPGVEAIGLADNKIFIWNQELGKTVLFDRLTHETSTLNLEHWEDLRASMDGQFLRYRVQYETENRLNIRWVLYEYDIINHTTRSIFTRDETVLPSDISVYEHCTPNRYGERWYCAKSLGRYKGSLPVTTTSIIIRDGEETPIDINLHFQETPQGDWYFLKSDQYDMGCGEDCVVELYSEEGNLLNTFIVPSGILPEGKLLHLFYAVVLDKNRVIVSDEFISGTLYMLSAGNKLTYLGIVPCAPCGGPSPDGHWRILYDLRDDDKPKTVIWDLQNEMIVLERDGVLDWDGYIDGGVALLDTNEYYSIADERTYRPERGLLSVFLILPNGVLLYARSEIFGDTMIGIYRHDEAGDHVLVEGGQIIDYSWGEPLSL